MKYAIPAVIVILALIGASGIYVVGAGHAGLVTRVGGDGAAHVGPGLHFKLPFLEHVTIYDARAIVSQAEPEDCKTRDGDAVRVAFHLRWQVADPSLYYRATGGEELQATQRMMLQVADALRAEVARHDLAGVLASGSDHGIGTVVRDAVAGTIRSQLGIALAQVEIGRVLPPDDALAAVYKRMEAEAKAAADTLRGQGEAKAAAIRAQGETADAQVVATADQAAATVRGEGDAEAARVYAAAATTDPRFFRYWSALETWRQSFSGGGAVIVLDKDSPLMQAIDPDTAGSVATPARH
jgi:membrane protease subunit HflC